MHWSNWISIDGLLKTLLIHGSSLKTSVAGICDKGSLRDTNPSSKWYVSPKEYPYRRYHGICHGFGYITSIHTLHNIWKVCVNIPYIYLEDVYIGFCVKRLGYKLENIGRFFPEEDIEYSPCNLKHPKSVLGHHVSLQQMKVVWNTPCDNSLTRIQFMFNIIMTVIPKFIVGQVLGVFMQMIKTTQQIFSWKMITIDIFTVDQALWVFVYMIKIMVFTSTMNAIEIFAL